jgi:4-hydroxy-4-methyl-2-oxoglutarate aldolase
MSSGEVAAALARLGSATIGESGGLAAHRRLRPAWAGATLAAPAYPVGCTPGDNLAVHVGVTKAPKGSVLVVDVGQVADRGYWGEVLTTAAEAAGLAGLILDGGVRDVAALEAHGFPVFSATIALTGATKDKPGTVGSPVRVGGIRVEAGDWVVADVDGVSFVPRGAVDDVLAAGRNREAKESGFFEALKSGSTTVELLGLDASLVRQGDAR